MIFIGLAGYLLPIPSLIWLWVRWFKSKPRFVPPVWRQDQDPFNSPARWRYLR